MSDDKIMVGVRVVPEELRDWLFNKRDWYQDDWERAVKAAEGLPKATIILRALQHLYNFLKDVPAYVRRDGAEVTVRFPSETAAIDFCRLVSRENMIKKQEARKR